MKCKYQYVVIFILIILGVFVRMCGLGGFYYSGDDIFHLFIAKADSIWGVLQRNSMDIHPPLIYVLVHLLNNFGCGTDFIRLPSLIFGTLIIPVVFLLIKRAVGVFEGFLMAMLATFSYGIVITSQVLRQYTLGLFFMFLSMYFFIRLKEKYDYKILFCHLLFSLFSVLSHYLMAIPVFSMFVVYAFLLHRNKAKVKKVLLWLVLHILLGLIVFASFYHNGHSQWSNWQTQVVNNRTEWMTQGYPGNLTSYLINFLAVVMYFSAPDLVVSVFMSTLIIIGIIYCFKKNKYLYFLFFLLSNLGASFLLAYTKAYPFWGSRQSLHLFPSFILMWAVSVRAIKEKLVLEMSKKAQVYASAFIFLLLMISALFFIYKSDFYRVHAYDEFPNTASEIKKLLETIDNDLPEADVIITDKQTGLLLAYSENNYSNELIYSDLVAFKYKSVPVLYKNIWGKKYEKEDLLMLLNKYQSMVSSGKEDVLILSSGWSQNGLGLLVQEISQVENCNKCFEDFTAWGGEGNRFFPDPDNRVIRLNKENVDILKIDCLK